MDTGTAVKYNPTVKNNQFCSTNIHPIAVLNDTLNKERTHNFTQANTQIVWPDYSAIQTQSVLSFFQSSSQRLSLNFQSPSLNDLNQSQSKSSKFSLWRSL